MMTFVNPTLMKRNLHQIFQIYKNILGIHKIKNQLKAVAVNLAVRLHIHDCKPGGNAYVRDSTGHYGWRTRSDGDGVSIFGASHIWVDHCTLSACTDGLIDAIHGSTAITISNNYMSHHDKVMLLGHSDALLSDKSMQVTIAFNHFGEDLIQRMPR